MPYSGVFHSRGYNHLRDRHPPKRAALPAHQAGHPRLPGCLASLGRSPLPGAAAHLAQAPGHGRISRTPSDALRPLPIHHFHPPPLLSL